MNWIRHFSQELLMGHETEPWHGPSTRSLLDGITAEEAASNPVPKAHSIWEIVLHMDAWQREVTRRLNTGFVPEIPEEGDWRPVLEISGKAWQRAQMDLDSSMHELLGKLNQISESMNEQGTRTVVSLARMLSGVLQHNAYHSGQIAIARRVILEERAEK